MNRMLSVLLAAVLLAGCSPGSGQPATQADAVQVRDAWVKAADEGMTAAFAQLTNDSAEEVRIASASTPAAARVELHEVVPDGGGAMQMRQKQGGFVIPAHADIGLTPGADHLMLMELTAPLQPGTDVEIIATFDDGSTLPITAQVRDFPGADEHYGDAHG
ncbi:copper chaperone PCu(A)C [Mycobacterium sp. PS03-16]|uniref:copper chaperone PCu(A)C n=1 Tax=Mycobacterium sp. PS03-16 TaxID=2559611 RepID=UPI001073783A|nr:copper chaperone PCu(A)C [Mycobacterium sp. PS03-16]TFV57781.1 copper chaperone PCu(A)C [Mycobacterium sp. PS03-16]